MNRRYRKYGNVRSGGFDSKKERDRYFELLLLQRAGEISNLQRQVKFVLTPTIREPDIVGPKGGRKPGKLIEKESYYKADFTYFDKNGNFVVEDVKGVRTPEYILKRKIMLHYKGIRIKET